MNKPENIEFFVPPKLPECRLKEVEDAIGVAVDIPERLKGCENKSCILATFW